MVSHECTWHFMNMFYLDLLGVKTLTHWYMEKVDTHTTLVITNIGLV